LYHSVQLTYTLHFLPISTAKTSSLSALYRSILATRTKSIQQSPLEAPHAQLVKAFLNFCEIWSPLTISQVLATDDTVIHLKPVSTSTR